MIRLLISMIAAVLSGAMITSSAFAQVANCAVPPGANTTNPAAPFYIDLTGLDLTTCPPTRDPHNPKYPNATELPDGQLPPVTANGNFIVGPTHAPAPDTIAQTGVPKGKIYMFTMKSSDSRIYHTALVRPEASFDAAVYTASSFPGDPSNLIVTASQAGTWSRTVSVYVPDQIKGKERVPLMVLGDGDIMASQVFSTLDNLIYQRRLPPMVAIAIQAGGQDAQGSQRGFEYDTVSGTYAEWVENEVLPLAQSIARVKLSRNPDARATIGLSSSGAAALSMAWFQPDLYHRVAAWSGTFVNQQWPHNPALPGGAWEFHSPYAGLIGPLLNTSGFALPTPSTQPPGSPLIVTSPKQPIRMWLEVGDRDLFYPVIGMPDGMHDWVLANENLIRVLATKGYAYQFVFARNAGHFDFATFRQTLPHALEYVWADFVARGDEQDDE